MRVFATFAALGVLLISACSDAAKPAPAHKPFRPFPQAATVKLFVESGKYTKDSEVILISEAGQALTPGQRTTIESALFVSPIDPTASSPACFIPHHFFRYYDAAGKQLGEVAVCFCCGGVRVDPARLSPLTEYEADYGKLEKLVQDMGLPTDIECD